MKVRYWEKAKKELSIKDDNLKKLLISQEMNI